MFNEFENMNSGSDNYSERDRLEIDDKGKKLGDKKQQKREQQMNDFNSNPRRGFGGGRGSGFGGGNRGGGSFLWGLIILLIVGGLIYVPIAAKNGTLPKPLRSLLNNDAQSNADNFMNDVQKFKKDSDKKFNSRGENYEEDSKPTFYDTNPLYDQKLIGEQSDLEYMVIVYTGDNELDKPFIDWVQTYEKETPKKDRFKIYRINMELAVDNYYVQDAISDDNYNLNYVPLLMIFHTPDKHKRLLDSIVKDPNQLEKVPDYLDGLMKEDNANR